MAEKPPYMGRVALYGLTPDGIPAAIYLAQGRSEDSRKRRLELYPAERRIHMNVNSQTSLSALRARAKENPAANPDLLLGD